ncbi:MAG TPA: hypothetical protein VHX66_00260 [Solirubrobacteraceae bacterium]|jgi:hypothetical protein|nr:hypothetical protein [Solirubrobacteraceae bacterium]
MTNLPDRIPYDGEHGDHCGDCDADVGQLHTHPRCDVQVCPVCSDQLAFCDHWADYYADDPRAAGWWAEANDAG